jgi:hypothetical protein
MHDAFAELRRYARNHNTPLIDVARAIADRTVPAERIIAGQSTARLGRADR